MLNPLQAALLWTSRLQTFQALAQPSYRRLWSAAWLWYPCRWMELVVLSWLVLQLTADALRAAGYDHPMGQRWRGIQDIDPRALTRDRLLRLVDEVDPADPHRLPSRAGPGGVGGAGADLEDA